MKNSTQTIVILKSIDIELKALLQHDLDHFKNKHTKQALINKAA